MTLPILRAVENREHDNFPSLLDNLVNDQVWVLDKLSRPFDQSGTAHMRQCV